MKANLDKKQPRPTVGIHSTYIKSGGAKKQSLRKIVFKILRAPKIKLIDIFDFDK